MKKLLLLPFLLFTTLANAQQTLGKITYENKLFIDKAQFANSNLPEGFADAFPSERKTMKVLYFTPDATLYENGTKSTADQQEYSEGNMTFRMVEQEPDEKVYTDIKGRKKTEQRDLMGKQFLVQSEALPATKWKTTGRQKKILGLPCMESTMMDETGKYQIKAWYTTAIPVSSGPEGMSGLPGMIMELSVGERQIITAVKIDSIDAKTLIHIKPPAKGKKVTAAEYDRIEQQKIAEMEQQFKGGGNVIFKVEK